MLSVLVANPKGGSGKSTISTNLAGYYAQTGKQVALGDVDRQQSSLHWLKLRADELPAISGWEFSVNDPVKPPKGSQVVIYDSPGGLHGKKLAGLIGQVDQIIVPIQPSPFDMWASAEFFDLLAEEKAIRKQKVLIGVVGVRVDPRTRIAKEFEQFLQQYDVPVLTWLRDTQVYVQAASEGESIFDLPLSRSGKDRDAWAPILQWLGEPVNAPVDEAGQTWYDK